MKSKLSPQLFLLVTCLNLPSVWQTAFAQSTVVQQNFPGLTITGQVAATYPIRYVNELPDLNNWLTLTNLVLPSSPYLFIDVSATNVAQRFYRWTNGTVNVDKHVGLIITGTVGSTNLIQYVEPPGNTTNWITLTNLVLPSSPYVFIDFTSPPSGSRVYRAEDIGAPPVITSADAALGVIGMPFQYQITAKSYLAITNYGATGLPAGLSVNNTNGLISGTPTQVGTNAVTITARNSTGPGNGVLTLSIRLSFATELVAIPAGSFVLGSPDNEPGRSSNEGPQTQVTLTHNFFIGKYEVSQAEYQGVVGSNPSLFTGNVNRPVEQVSWQEATDFCALLTAQDRQSGRISPTSTYRLPTEAEWEYAARAGTSTRYSFGDDAANLNQYAWYSGDGAGMTYPVGQKLPNPWGLFDVYGNTWELCSDWLGTYPGGSLTDPSGPATGSNRVIRGGSWFSIADFCRSAVRLGVLPNGRFSDVGFRIVLVP